MKQKYLVSLLSEQKHELLSIVINTLNKKLLRIESIQASKTDIGGHVLIYIELLAEAQDIKHLTAKFGNIIEVYHVQATLLDECVYQKTGFFRMDIKGINSLVINSLQKFGATISYTNSKEVVIQKSGRDEDIRQLYNLLEGPHLLSFHESAAIALQAHQADDYPVISQAA